MKTIPWICILLLGCIGFNIYAAVSSSMQANHSNVAIFAALVAISIAGLFRLIGLTTADAIRQNPERE